MIELYSLAILGGLGYLVNLKNQNNNIWKKLLKKNQINNIHKTFINIKMFQ